MYISISYFAGILVALVWFFLGGYDVMNSYMFRCVIFLRSRQLCSYSRIFQHFKRREGSLQCSEEPYELHTASL
jgi:hypothetical protein